MLKKVAFVLLLGVTGCLTVKAQKGDTLFYFMKTRFSATGSYAEVVENMDAPIFIV
jgi:hypothetical protein